MTIISRIVIPVVLSVTPPVGYWEGGGGGDVCVCVCVCVFVSVRVYVCVCGMQ